MTGLPKPPRLEGFNFDESLLARIAAVYGFHRIDSLRPLLLDGDHVTLIDVRSETARKMPFVAGGARWFLKEVPWYCDDTTLAFSHAWQSALDCAGLPVAPPRATIDGNTWVRVDGVRLVVMPQVEGRRWSGDPAEACAAAATLARLHLVSPPVGGHAGDPFSAAEAHVDLALQQGVVDETGAARFRKALTCWRGACDTAALRAGGVHGDYSPWNLLFGTATGGQGTGGASVVAVLDFDNAHAGPVVRDVAEALLTCCSVRYRGDSTNFAREVHGPLSATATAMLRSYTALRHLEPMEVAAVGPVAGAVATELACLGLVRADHSPALAPLLTDWACEVAGAVAAAVERLR